LKKKEDKFYFALIILFFDCFKIYFKIKKKKKNIKEKILNQSFLIIFQNLVGFM